MVSFSQLPAVKKTLFLVYGYYRKQIFCPSYFISALPSIIWILEPMIHGNIVGPAGLM